MKYVLKEYELIVKVATKEKEIRTVGIGRKRQGSNIIVPDPLTNFLKQRYRRKGMSLSHQKNAGYAVCKFLNFCMERVEANDEKFQDLKEDGVKGLTLEHGAEYISHLSIKVMNEEITPQYLNGQMIFLNAFFEWLNESEIVKEKIDVVYEERKVKNQKGKTIKVMKKENLFDKDELDTILPNMRSRPKDKLVDFGKDRKRITNMFLEIVKNNAPEIYLGVTLQFYAGLRKGEVLNLTTDAVKKTNNQYIIEVRDRSKDLFKDKKNTKLEQVKVERNQGVFFKEKIEYAIKINEKVNKGIRNECNALLNSKRTKKPMTSSVYTTAFEKCKELLLEQLMKENDYENYRVLSVYPWSTHICRGVFTNLCLDAEMTITQVALARGDSSIASVIKYIDKRAVQQLIGEALEEILEDE